MKPAYVKSLGDIVAAIAVELGQAGHLDSKRIRGGRAKFYRARARHYTGLANELARVALKISGVKP